jgi:hypothetical protein
MGNDPDAHDPSARYAGTSPSRSPRWGGSYLCAALSAGRTFRAILSNIGVCSSSMG